MRKNCWTSRRPLAGWFLLMLVVGCSQEPRVTGQVFDEFGKPVIGATVQVQGTTFTAATDTSGKYLLSYVPGNFTVNVQKQGFTSAHFALNITSPMQYPAAPVTLIPLPTTPGFYLFGRTDYQGVYYGAGIAGKVIDNVERIGVLNFAFKDQEFSLYTGGKAVPTFPNGHLKFLDSVGLGIDFKLVRVGENGRVLYRKQFMDGTVKDSISIIPEQIRTVDQVLIREVDLGPGHYAYVAFIPQKINWAQTLPTPLETGYEFWVK
jgi:hypothetical protein